MNRMCPRCESRMPPTDTKEICGGCVLELDDTAKRLGITFSSECEYDRNGLGWPVSKRAPKRARLATSR